MNTDLFDKAAKFAIDAHRGAERKGKGFPYIVHPMEAVSIVATMTNDQELLAAAALHDVIEDTDITAEELRREFGDRVADLVAAETDVAVEGQGRAESWRMRKQLAIERLAAAPRDVKIVAIGDKLSNMRAIARDYVRQGDELWNLFNVKDKASHAWHYRGLEDALRELEGTFAFSEFEKLVKQVFD